ncbi:MAG TPA: O-antigen ligase family protein, partial [Thermoanaerobaculia bacterium]|nr:O-antigen ligase family protein [Thermoanaerobaculia bacterium]
MPANLAERICAGVFAAWLLWLPLPYGSNEEFARAPLIGVPLLLCVVAALLRARDNEPMRVPNAWRIWTVGALLFIGVVALQLVPLPASILRIVSPESDAIWRAADRVSALIAARGPHDVARPISVNPAATLRELFRIVALLATFQCGALLIRSSRRRVLLASVLSVSALFQMFYGLNEAASHRYEVWGWRNSRIFNRVTGTFVNPNHFAHYMAIIAPVALFLAAIAWHASAHGAPLKIRIARLIERRAPFFAAGILTALGCLAAILVAQSRGGLLAAGTGMLAIGAMIAARGRDRSDGGSLRHLAMYLCGGAAAGIVLVLALVLFLGPARTVARFRPTAGEEVTFVGRRTGIESAFGVWRRFPLFGSGLGTLADVVSMTQKRDLSKLYNHAHDDYAEIAATTGTLGAVIALVAVAGGYGTLLRAALRRRGNASWNRRAFQLAALTSLTVALVHALFDFNFFIAANASTLAAIAGAAVPLRAVTARFEPAAARDSESADWQSSLERGARPHASRRS